MSQNWEPVEGVELHLDIEDYEESKNYQAAFEKMSEEEKERIFMMIETAKMLKLTIKNMEQRGA